MPTEIKEVETQIGKLAKESFEGFCKDIAVMLDVKVECRQQEVRNETLDGLKKRFGKLAAANAVKAEGALNGNFYLVLGREGLFTLGGVVEMQPAENIAENIKKGTIKDTEAVSDSVIEAFSILVGALDKTFREKLAGHKSFAANKTFIGDLWETPAEKTGFAESGDEAFLLASYKMAINHYPAFDFSALFPKRIFNGVSKGESEQPAKAKGRTKKGKTAAPEANAAKPVKETPPADKTDDNKKEAAPEKSEAVIEEKTADKTVANNVIEEKVAAVDKEKAGPISETIRKMVESPALLPSDLTPPAGDASGKNPSLSAADVMQKNVVWSSPDESVQQAFEKMQQHDTNYIVIGRDEKLEGIVSKSDLMGAMSPYLKPPFTKWRRPLDDATLQIRLKWIMSKPVQTTESETPLATVMEKMCRSEKHCMPVTDKQGKVVGMVTVLDVMKAMSK
jgi:CBS domain-containing protein